MKIIEAMKKIKVLVQKSADLREKISMHCADQDYETPVYGDCAAQRVKVDKWLQSCTDIHQEIGDLQVRIERTNHLTDVMIEFGGKEVTKTIAHWLRRRRSLAALDWKLWTCLTDRGLKEGALPSSTNQGDPRVVKIRRYYDPNIRDEKLTLYKSEPLLIDAKLEVTNAITDLI